MKREIPKAVIFGDLKKNGWRTSKGNCEKEYRKLKKKRRWMKTSGIILWRFKTFNIYNNFILQMWFKNFKYITILNFNCLQIILSEFLWIREWYLAILSYLHSFYWCVGVCSPECFWICFQHFRWLYLLVFCCISYNCFIDLHFCIAFLQMVSFLHL